MQISEDPSNHDIHKALIQLENRFDRLENQIDSFGDRLKQLNDQLENLDYKFEVYQKGAGGMVKLAMTTVIATAATVSFFNLSSTIAAIIIELAAAKG
jgi:ferritin-like metal-binding protein YciE